MDLKNKLSIYTKESIKDVMIHSKNKNFTTVYKEQIWQQKYHRVHLIYFFFSVIFGGALFNDNELVDKNKLFVKKEK